MPPPPRGPNEPAAEAPAAAADPEGVQNGRRDPRNSRGHPRGGVRALPAEAPEATPTASATPDGANEP